MTEQAKLDAATAPLATKHCIAANGQIIEACVAANMLRLKNSPAKQAEWAEELHMDAEAHAVERRMDVEAHAVMQAYYRSSVQQFGQMVAAHIPAPAEAKVAPEI